MIVVYLAGPLTPVGHETRPGNIERMKGRYHQLSRDNPGHVFIMPWLLNAEVFTETEANRRVGIERNCAVILRCDELWLVGDRISSGMAAEADWARDHGIKVLDRVDVMGVW